MSNPEFKPSDDEEPEFLAVQRHNDDGLSIFYKDGTYRKLRQPASVILPRIEDLDRPIERPVRAKRRSHKLALTAATLIIAEGVIVGSSILNEDGDIGNGLDAAASTHISAFADSIDYIEDNWPF